MPTRIVDSHHHLILLPEMCPDWLALEPSPEAIASVLGDDISPIRRTYLPEDLRADFAGLGLEKTVCIEMGGMPDPSAEAAWLQSFADTEGLPDAVVPAAYLEQPGVGELLEEYANTANVRGVRQMLNAHPDPSLTFAEHELSRSPDWRRGFKLLGRHGFAFDLQCYPNQFGEAADLARAFPEISIAIDHLGMPIARDAAGVALWRESVAPLAACENVTMKVGGVGMIARSWTRDGLRPFAVAALELFGPDRCMFESNFPVEALFVDVPTMVADCEAICLELGLGAGERDAFFAGSAERVYRI